MNVRVLICFLLLGVGNAFAQGFAGLGTTAEGFAMPERGGLLQFPQDHGAHPDYRIEWWYVTANLTGTGRRGLRLAMDAVPHRARAGRGGGMEEPAGLVRPCRRHQRHDPPRDGTLRPRRHRPGWRDGAALRRLDRRLAHGGRQFRPAAAHGDGQGFRLRHRDAGARPARAAWRQGLFREVGQRAGELLLFTAFLRGRGHDHAAAGRRAGAGHGLGRPRMVVAAFGGGPGRMGLVFALLRHAARS